MTIPTAQTPDRAASPLQVAVVTLGCARNEVDSEELAGRLEADGFVLVADPEDADTVVVNTCGFVEAAKKDSVDTLLEAADLKDGGRTQAVVAVGCLAERYGTCGTTSNPNLPGTAGNLWSDSNSVWRPIFCINNSSKNPATAGYEICAKFQVRPIWNGTCDTRLAQSPHVGGITVCLGDGSVRFLNASITATTWAAACNPQDGAPLGSDW